MKGGSRVLFLLALLIFSRTDAQPQSPDLCHRRSIPITLDPNSKFQLVGHWLSFDAPITGELYVRNRTGRALNALTILVNYLDRQRNLLFSIPYQANVRGAENTIQSIRPFMELRLAKPVPRDGVVGLVGTNLLSSTEVPASAAISFINLTFDDRSGTSMGFLPEMLHANPLLEETPEDFRIQISQDTLPKEFLVTLKIDPYGRVTEINPLGSLGPDASSLEEVSGELRKWRFYPAIQNGYATESTLRLLLEFRPQPILPIRRCFLQLAPPYPPSFVHVTLGPIPDTPDRWVPYYSGFAARGKLSQIQVTTGVTKITKSRHD